MSREYVCPVCGFKFHVNYGSTYNTYMDMDWKYFKIRGNSKFSCICGTCGKKHKEGWVRLNPRFDTSLMKGLSAIWFTEHPQYEYCCKGCAKKRGLRQEEY